MRWLRFGACRMCDQTLFLYLQNESTLLIMHGEKGASMTFQLMVPLTSEVPMPCAHDQSVIMLWMRTVHHQVAN